MESSSSGALPSSIEQEPQDDDHSNKEQHHGGTTANVSQDHHSLSHAYQTYLSHDAKEQNHWHDVCRSFRQYAIFAMEQWANHQYRLHALTEEHRRYLPASLQQETSEFQKRAAEFKNAAIRNQFVLDCILRHAGQAHSQEQPHIGDTAVSYSTDAQMSKVSSVLKSLVRDWSLEGKEERDAAYQPLFRSVSKYLPVPSRISVPGAGVGRLACELAALGHQVQGNEFSLYMLLASDFILNGPWSAQGDEKKKQLSISPWLLESRNLHSVKDQLRIVSVPDVDPYELIMKNQSPMATCNENENTALTETGAISTSNVVPVEDAPVVDSVSTADFSMAAGDFASIYSNEQQRGKWDAVVACFFLDASPSIVEYLKIAYDMLKPGGFLFHFGPLLWHWSGPAMRPDDNDFHDYRERFSYLDPKYLSSIDLTWEEIREIMINIGFEILESSTGHKAFYTADQKSMMKTQYNCFMFVAKKSLDC